MNNPKNSGKGENETTRTDREDNEKNSEKEKKHDQDLLDEGIEESFPASDPPSVSHVD
ncbi:hypothetical protein ACXYTJ_01060 [Gilvimarinus sp. F26214L]|uniref:hypothetical protein n=1 Tax=Gilvimarinus sp. DZF01 TaxID=3461371 RepID=UPI0040464E56